MPIPRGNQYGGKSHTKTTWKPPTSSANTAARRVQNCKLKANETPPTHNNRSRAGCGVWAGGEKKGEAVEFAVCQTINIKL